MADTDARMRQIIGSTGDWATHNLVLGAGELALERLASGGVRARVGDGVTAFSGAPYLEGPLDLAAADLRYVQEAETFTDGGASAANKWPRLNSQGRLNASLVNIPSPLDYKGTVDPTQPPPLGPNPGDMWVCNVGGVVAAGWGAPAAGQTAYPGDWLIMNNAAQWQLVPMSISGVAEAPTDGKTYGRGNSTWSAAYQVDSLTASLDVSARGVLASGQSVFGGSAVPASGAGGHSKAFFVGDLSLVGPAPGGGSIAFNGSNDGTNWKMHAAGYMGAISFDGTTGGFGLYTTSGAAAAGAANMTMQPRIGISPNGFVTIGGGSAASFGRLTLFGHRSEHTYNGETRHVYRNEAGASDSKVWDISNTGNGLQLRALNDGESFVSTAISCQRHTGDGLRHRIHNVAFWAEEQERARVNTQGFGVGTADPGGHGTSSQNIVCLGSATANIKAVGNIEGRRDAAALQTANVYIVDQTVASGASSYWQLSAGGGIANIYMNCGGGGVYMPRSGTAWVANSDERIKVLGDPIADALAKLGKLRTLWGRYKSDDESERRPFLIAQDVRKVLPEIVRENAAPLPGNPDARIAPKFGPKLLGFAPTDLVPVLVAAINELAAMTAAQEKRLAAMETALKKAGAS